MWAENRRRRSEIRQLHFEAIKEGVFEPLLNRTEKCFIPIITRKCSNVVEMFEFQTVPDAPIGQYGGESRTKLTVLTPSVLLKGQMEQEDWAMGHDVSGLILEADEHLYTDVKDNHERRLIGGWEAFIDKVSEYNSECLAYVNETARQIVAQTKLPELLSYTGQPGVNAIALAVFVWERQLGVGFYRLWLEQTGNLAQLSVGNKMVASGTQTEMQNCSELLQRLVEDRARATELLDLMSNLKLAEDVEALKKEFIGRLHSQRLKGNCPYIRP